MTLAVIILNLVLGLTGILLIIDLIFRTEKLLDAGFKFLLVAAMTFFTGIILDLLKETGVVDFSVVIYYVLDSVFIVVAMLAFVMMRRAIGEIHQKQVGRNKKK